MLYRHRLIYNAEKRRKVIFMPVNKHSIPATVSGQAFPCSLDQF
jgi:hypothetical protein